MESIRVIELFAGIGAQRQALKDAGIEHKVIAISEIDKWAIQSYNAIHGDTLNLGDISKIDHLPSCDLLTYSFPCQDLSIAGNKAGMKKGSGTRSGLLWEVERLLNEMYLSDRLPKYLLMENVDAILHKRNIRDFGNWVDSLSELGYTSSYKVINSTQFGVPQNRKRCYMVSILGDEQFIFPTGHPTSKRLKDVLEEGVGREYYLKKNQTEKYVRNEKIHESNIIIAGDLNLYNFDVYNRIYSPCGISPALAVYHGACPKIDENPSADEVKIRSLTPLEFWRLQGQPDENYRRAAAVNSRSQLCKQAGNSISVPVLTAIFEKLLTESGGNTEIRRRIEDYC